MEEVKELVEVTFEEKIQALKETIDSLSDMQDDFEEKLRKLNNKLNFVKDDISYLEK